MRELKGIDVSVLNGGIDWARVRAGGVEFAIVKATQGRGEGVSTRHLKRFTDGNFKENLLGATAVGIACGVYHYFTAKTVGEATEEANYFLSVISPYKDKITLWVAVDVESKYLDGIAAPELTECVGVFLDRVAAAGYKPMLYTNPNYLTYRLDRGALGAYDIWLAHYNVAKPMQVAQMKIWQYGYTAVDGVRGQVDGNRGYFDLPVSQNAPTASGEPQKEDKPVYSVGDKYTVRAGDVYSNGKAVPKWLIGKTLTVSGVLGGRIRLKEIFSWVKV